jgi:hypothetical protein
MGNISEARYLRVEPAESNQIARLACHEWMTKGVEFGKIKHAFI